MQPQSFNEELVAQKGLQRIATWGKVMGIVMMITGGIAALSGLIYFIVGAIPGAITVFLGYLTYKTGAAAAAIRQGGDTRALSDLFHHYGLYLLVSFIMFAVSIAVTILMFLLFGMFFFTSFNNGF